jgi:hypothetical protein
MGPCAPSMQFDVAIRVAASQTGNRYVEPEQKTTALISDEGSCGWIFICCLSTGFAFTNSFHGLGRQSYEELLRVQTSFMQYDD